MKLIRKSRPRLLIICKEDRLRTDLITLLTGYGYFVDYVEDRKDGLKKFQQHKQLIVIIDIPALPRDPEKIFKEFLVYKKNPIILIAAKKEEQDYVKKYLERREVYDILHLPLNVNSVKITLRRLVGYSQLMARNEFLRILIELLIFFMPLGILLIYLFIQSQK